MNLTTFRIDSLIVHDVPRHLAGDESEEIVLSDASSSLDASLRNLFTERVTRSLSKNAFEVERDPAATSPVPDHVRLLAAAQGKEREPKLVQTSQDMARHLFASQTGSNPAGLLVVALGRVDGKGAVSVMKLEREDAIRVSPTQRHGHTTFDVQYLRDLMLGKNTRVFKASLFKPVGKDDLDGLVSDTQRNDPTADVANFFLRRFLGCRLKVAPDVATRQFFTATQEFINTIPDPEKKARYEIALIAAMNTPGQTMTPGSLANQLDTEDRQPFRNVLAQQGAPTGRFDKDNRLIAGQLRQLVFGFERSRLRLSGPPEDVEEFVRINPEGGAPVEIHDQIDDVRGGTR